MSSIEYRALTDIEWRIDGPDDDGTFEGRAVKYGEVDTYGTTFHPRTFKKGGLRVKDEFALLFMHDPAEPIGVFRAEERDDGLWISGQFDPTPEGEKARTRARTRSARELSVGFVRTDLPDHEKLREMSEDDFKEVMRNIRGARLVEVSQITARFASVPGSALTTVRAALDGLYDTGDVPDLAAVEAERNARAGDLARRRAAARARLAMAVPSE